MKRLLILAALLPLTTPLLSACATMPAVDRYQGGSPALFDQAVMGRIVEGTTTKDQLLGLIGKPQSVDFVPTTGGEQWGYATVHVVRPAGPAGFLGDDVRATQRTATVLIGRDNIVKRVTVGESQLSDDALRQLTN